MQGYISEILEFLVRVTQEGFSDNFIKILLNSWEYCVKEVLNVFLLLISLRHSLIIYYEEEEKTLYGCGHVLLSRVTPP